MHPDLREIMYDLSDLTSCRNPQREKFKNDLRKLIEKAKTTKL